MKIKFKNVALLAIICVLFLGFTVVKKFNPSNKVAYNEGGNYVASYIIPEDLVDLEERSELVVRGYFTGERVTDKDESLVGPSSISKFSIEEVYKGSLNDMSISVLEPCEFDENNFINIDGYIPMKKNEEYLLFLRGNNTKEGKQYSIISLSFGKYNLSSNKSISPVSRVIKYFEEVSDLDFATPVYEKCDIYNRIKSQVLKQYL